MSTPTPFDLKIDPATGDLDMTAAGDLQLVYDLDGVVQVCKETIMLFVGENILDLDEGTPWYETVFAKSPDPAVIQAVFRQRILSSPGITGVTRFEFTLGADRKASISFDATTDFGKFTLTLPGKVAAVPAIPQKPVVISYSPPSGPVGASVTVTGKHFNNAMSVKVNGVSAMFAVTSNTTIDITIPSTTTGPVTVTTAGGTGIGPDFTITVLGWISSSHAYGTAAPSTPFDVTIPDAVGPDDHSLMVAHVFMFPMSSGPDVSAPPADGLWTLRLTAAAGSMRVKTYTRPRDGSEVASPTTTRKWSLSGGFNTSQVLIVMGTVGVSDPATAFHSASATFVSETTAALAFTGLAADKYFMTAYGRMVQLANAWNGSASWSSPITAGQIPRDSVAVEGSNDYAFYEADILPATVGSTPLAAQTAHFDATGVGSSVGECNVAVILNA